MQSSVKRIWLNMFATWYGLQSRVDQASKEMPSFVLTLFLHPVSLLIATKPSNHGTANGSPHTFHTRTAMGVLGSVPQQQDSHLKFYIHFFLYFISCNLFHIYLFHDFLTLSIYYSIIYLSLIHSIPSQLHSISSRFIFINPFIFFIFYFYTFYSFSGFKSFFMHSISSWCHHVNSEFITLSHSLEGRKQVIILSEDTDGRVGVD